MVQRKVPSKLGIQADHVKSDKHLANLKLYSSQHQDGKSRGADMKKKMKKSRSIKLSDLEALQTSSSPSRKSLPQLGKPPPLHVPTTTASASASAQKQHPVVRNIDGSPNYMKPTSSSHAKKELFPVSLRNTQSGSDFKNLPRKSSSDSKARCVSKKKPTKTLTRSSSLSLVMTLTKTTSFKASRSCPRKSTRASMCADMSTPQRATCSSTLKDSKFPQYLMLNHGGTESGGISAMKVCPYNYCSLNGHHHAALTPLKSFMSARRRLLKTQKSMKLVEALSPRRLKVPCKIEKEKSDIEMNVFDEKPAYDEIGMDFFIEIYDKEKETRHTGADEMGKIDFYKENEDQEDIKSTIEDDVKPDAALEFEIDLEENFEKSFDDVAIEVDTKGSFCLEQNAGDSDLNNHPSWFHEEISMGSYCSDEASYDGEHMEDVGMDGSDSKATDMEWEEEEFRKFDHEEDADSAVFTEEDTDSKVESLSECSHDVSVIWLDDMLSSYYEDILAEEELQDANVGESNCFEDQPHGISSVLYGTSGNSDTQENGYSSSGRSCDQSSLTEDNGGENEKHVDDAAMCNLKVLDEEKSGNGQCPKMSETCKIDETTEDRNSSLENNDESISEGNRVQLFDAQDESTIAVQDQELLAKDQDKAMKFQSTSSIGGEEKDTIKNWKGANRHKRPIEDDDEMRKFNPREPNFLPLVPEPESEKVDLKHQMIDERKNAEDWMIDCALRQVVTKLAPARKKKVALLVEAFETVMPIPKCDTHMRNNSTFAHAGRIQACI